MEWSYLYVDGWNLANQLVWVYMFDILLCLMLFIYLFIHVYTWYECLRPTVNVNILSLRWVWMIPACLSQFCPSIRCRHIDICRMSSLSTSPFHLLVGNMNCELPHNVVWKVCFINWNAALGSMGDAISEWQYIVYRRLYIHMYIYIVCTYTYIIFWHIHNYFCHLVEFV